MPFDAGVCAVVAVKLVGATVPSYIELAGAAAHRVSVILNFVFASELQGGAPRQICVAGSVTPILRKSSVMSLVTMAPVAVLVETVSTFIQTSRPTGFPPV